MIFVTGASGLIGSWLLLELSKKGEEIRAMKRPNSNLKAVEQLFLEFSDLETYQKIEWLDVDLLDVPSLSKVLEGVSRIYHCAALVSFDDRKAKEMNEVNVLGTTNLVNMSIDLGIPEFVYVSSIATLDLSPGETEINENSKWNPDFEHSEYAISKKKAEMEVWRASQEGVNVLVVHPSVIIGSLDGKRESEKIFKLASNSKAYTSNGITGFVDVRDVVAIMIELVNQNLWNQRFILSSENFSYQSVFDFIRQELNLKASTLVSVQKLKFIQIFTQISKLFGGKYLSKASLHGLIGKSNYSNQKVKEILKNDFIPIEESLQYHLKRYQSIKK